MRIPFYSFTGAIDAHESVPANPNRPGSTEGHARGVWSQWMRMHQKRLQWVLRVDGERAFKRALDIAGALMLVPVVAPILLIAGLLIKLTDGGPIFFWQKRVGRFGRVFDFPKLRSMVVNAESVRKQLEDKNEHQNGVTFKIRKDPRITWIGRIIRRWSIDELPQFWCVLTGDMSLVGPRPALPSEVARYSLANRRRLDVIPGLTCLWQIKGRAEIPFNEQVEMDVTYIQDQSFLMDLRILISTVPAVLNGKGAY